MARSFDAGAQILLDYQCRKWINIDSLNTPTAKWPAILCCICFGSDSWRYCGIIFESVVRARIYLYDPIGLSRQSGSRSYCHRKFRSHNKWLGLYVYFSVFGKMLSAAIFVVIIMTRILISFGFLSISLRCRMHIFSLRFAMFLLHFKLIRCKLHAHFLRTENHFCHILKGTHGPIFIWV